MAIFYGASAALAAAAGAAAGLGVLFWLGWLAFAGHLATQARRLEPQDATLALRLFRSNRDAGLLLLAAIAAGPGGDDAKLKLGGAAGLVLACALAGCHKQSQTRLRPPGRPRRRARPPT